MVSPKHKAINYTDREKIINSFSEIGRIRPDKKKIVFLINLFNQFHNNEMLSWKSYSTCGDCRRALSNFFRYVIEEWKKK